VREEYYYVICYDNTTLRLGLALKLGTILPRVLLAGGRERGGIGDRVRVSTKSDISYFRRAVYTVQYQGKSIRPMPFLHQQCPSLPPSLIAQCL